MKKPNAELEPLRFVILCDSLDFESWQAECLRETVASPSAIPVGVVIRSESASDPARNKWQKRWRERHLALWRLFDRFCVRPFSKAIRPVDLSELLGELPSHVDRPVKLSKFSESLAPESIEFIRTLRPDFVVRFAYGILRGEVLDVSPYGLWSFHHGDPTKFRGQPPGFWEMAKSAKTAGAILQVLSNELDAGRVLHSGEFQITTHSYAKTRDTLYYGVASWIKRVSSDIQLNGWENFPQSGVTEKGAIYKQPENGVMISFFIRTIAARFSAQFQYRLHRQDWSLAIVSAPIHVVAGLSGQDAQLSALKSAQWMLPPRGEFYADPFGVQTAANQIQVFFERFVWRDGRGDIATVQFDGAAFGSVQDVLSTPTHLSYTKVQ